MFDNIFINRWEIMQQIARPTYAFYTELETY